MKHLFTILTIFLLSGSLFAQTISIQGVLRDPNGRSVDDGFHSVTFKIYDASTAGNTLWTDTYANLETKHGVFQVNLGENTTLDGLAFDMTYYVGVTVENFLEMTPRIALTIYPYSKAILGQNNKFPSTGDVVLAQDNFVIQQGQLKLEGPSGRILFNDGTFLNTADFAGPASGLLNPSDITINADKDTLAAGAINFQIAGQTKAFINNNGNAVFTEPVIVGPFDYGHIVVGGAPTGSAQGGLLQLVAAADYTANVQNYTLKTFLNDFNITKTVGNVESTLMAITPAGDMSISGGLAAGNSLLSAASLTAGTFVQAGSSTSLNTVLQTNYLQANNNGGASTLNLNPNGGAVTAYQGLELGANDVRAGYINLFGAGSGSAQGGRINFFKAADHDANDVSDYWFMEADNDDFRIGNIFSSNNVLTINQNNLVGIGSGANDPQYHLSIGDHDTGINWVSDGVIEFKSNTATTLHIAASGNVGIGSVNPVEGKLVVNGLGNNFNSTLIYYLDQDGHGGPWAANPWPSDFSIYSFGRVASQGGFFVLSDRRVKEISGISKSDKDLNILTNLRITDYTYIDKAEHGYKKEKKLIAQEVRETYPQAVSLSVGFIPNILAKSISSSYQESNNLLTIGIEKKHGLIKGDVVKVFLENGVEKTEVISVSDDYTFTIQSDVASAKAFVYGKQVDDYHTLDYDAISMLNVSATQELAKRSVNQEKRIAALEAENAALKKKLAKVDVLEARLNALMGIDDNTASIKKSKIVKK